MQAFTGGGMGQTEITGIIDNGDDTFDVTTDQVTTVTQTHEYTVDPTNDQVTGSMLVP